MLLMAMWHTPLQLPFLLYKPPWQYNECVLLASTLASVCSSPEISWRAEGEEMKGQGWKPAGKLTRSTLLLT